ncbi:MAG: hypothetical protein GY771_03845 [bacterium]|nr:hypothetical protein [bacterium]
MVRKILLGLVSFAVFAGVLFFGYGQLTAAPREEAPEILTKDYVLMTADMGEPGHQVNIVIMPPSEAIKAQYR